MAREWCRDIDAVGMVVWIWSPECVYVCCVVMACASYVRVMGGCEKWVRMWDVGSPNGIM